MRPSIQKLVKEMKKSETLFRDFQENKNIKKQIFLLKLTFLLISLKDICYFNRVSVISCDHHYIILSLNEYRNFDWLVEYIYIFTNINNS